jgi:serine/threonine protein kinase
VTIETQQPSSTPEPPFEVVTDTAVTECLEIESDEEKELPNCEIPVDCELITPLSLSPDLVQRFIRQTYACELVAWNQNQAAFKPTKGFIPLPDLLKQGPLPDPKSAFKNILRSLHSVRQKFGSIRRFHPSNLHLNPASSECRILLSDTLFSESPSELPADLNFEQIKYLAPEETFGRTSDSVASWVLGCLLFEACFGRHPFAN